MKRTKIILYVSLSTLLLFTLFACQSGENRGTVGTTAGDQTDAAATEEAAPAPGETQADQLEKLQQAHAAMNKRMADLHAEYDAIPTIVKKNAINCDQLEEMFEGYYEKGEYRTEEIKKIKEELEEEKGNSGKADSYYGQAIQEFQEDLPALEADFQRMQQAVVQLKTSVPKNGVGVVLLKED